MICEKTRRSAGLSREGLAVSSALGISISTDADA